MIVYTQKNKESIDKSLIWSKQKSLTFVGTLPTAVNTVCQYDHTNIIKTMW